MRYVALVSVVAILLASSGAGDRLVAAAGPPETSVARLDAIVVDREGRPVRDLAAKDFEVAEEGSLRPIENVQFVGVDTAAPVTEPLPIDTSGDEQAEASRDGTRLFALLLDEYHVSPGPGVARIRSALTDFIDHNLGPNDLVLIVKPLDSLPNLRLTRDRDVIREAIEGFDGRKGDYTPRSTLEQELVASAQPRVDQERAQIVISALNAIAVHLGTLRTGRKTIVLVSDGFGRGIPRRRFDPFLLPTIEMVVRSASRSGASIYPIVSGALEGDADTASQDNSTTTTEGLETLRTLAQGTDGQAILTSRALKAGLDAIVSDSSGYYVITFQPAYQKDTGRFHPVAVTVTRAGVTLRTRNGYWEPVPDAAAALRSLEPVVPPMTPHVSALIRPWFGFTRAADEGKTRVHFVWEPAPKVPGDRSRVDTPARVRLNALNTDGTLAFEGAVGTSRPAAGDEPSDEPVQVSFDASPGRLYLRMQIEDETGKLIDTDVRSLVVGQVSGPVAFGTVMVFRARTALELRALEKDPGAVPVTARQFSRTDHLLVRIPVYASSAEPEVTVKLLPTRGAAMRELPVKTLPESNLRQIDLPLAGLAPAEYRLEFFATTGEGAARDAIGFRVTP